MDVPNDEEARRAASFARQDASDAQVRAQLVAKLGETASRRAALEATIELVDKRLRYLTIAVKRWEALCQATADEMASAGIDLSAATPMSTQGGKSRKDRRRAGGKKKGPVAATSLPDAQCGLDVRLVYDDAAWRDFVTSPFGTELLEAHARGEAEKVLEMALGDLEGVCLETRKRCERHAGWQKVREADFAVEKAVLVRHGLLRLVVRLVLTRSSLSRRIAASNASVSSRPRCRTSSRHTTRSSRSASQIARAPARPHGSSRSRTLWSSARRSWRKSGRGGVLDVEVRVSAPPRTAHEEAGARTGRRAAENRETGAEDSEARSRFRPSCCLSSPGQTSLRTGVVAGEVELQLVHHASTAQRFLRGSRARETRAPAQDSPRISCSYQ